MQDATAPMPSHAREDGGLVLPSPDDQTLATRGDVNRAVAALKPTIRNYLIIGVLSGNVTAAFVAKYVGSSAAVQTALDAITGLAL